MYQSKWGKEAPERSEVDSQAGKLILEFGTDWCPHCQNIQPQLKELLTDSSVVHWKLEDSKGRKLGRTFGVRLWPNFVLMLDGDIVHQLARPSEDELRQAIEAWLKN